MPTSYRSTLIAVPLLLAAVAAGCNQTRATASKTPPPPPEVAYVTIEPRHVTLTTELPGRTSAMLVAEVRPQVGGIVLKRLFTEGADVKTGEVLYEINPSTYQAAYASAKAALARAEANVMPRRLKAERFRELVAINAVSRQDADDADAALRQAEAEVEGAGAALEAAQINLAYTRVTAPISGRIGRSAVTTGALVTANQPAALATIQKLDPVYVDVTQSSTNLLKLREKLAAGKLRQNARGAVVKLFLEDGAAYPLAGTLKFSDVTVNQGTGSVTIRTVFPNPKGILLPGMYVRAVLEEGVDEHGIVVPQRGVARDPTGKPVALVVGTGDKVESRILEVSRVVGNGWLVEKGLAAGDRVVVEGLQRAKPGDLVRPVPFATSTTPARAPAAGPPSAAPSGVKPPAAPGSPGSPSRPSGAPRG